MNYPKFKECYKVERIGDEGIVLLTEQDYYWITGKPFIVISPYLTGEYSVDELLDKLEDQISMAEVFYAIEFLKDQGHLADANNILPQAKESYWHLFDVDAATAVSNLSQKKVGIKTIGNIGNVAFSDDLIKSADISIAGTDETPDIYLVITDDYDRQELHDWNKQMLTGNTPWLLVKPVGVLPWVGPLFNCDGESACWDCLMQRIRANRQMESYIQSLSNSKEPIITSRSAYPTTMNIALNMGVMEIAKFLTSKETPSLKNTLVTIDTKKLDVEKHTVVKRPQCKVCGREQHYRRSREITPVTLKPSLKMFRNDGGHRTSLPEVTFDKYKHLISAYTGVVSSLSRLDKFGESSLIYTYGAGHNFAMMNHKGMYFMMKNLRGRSGGKGMTDMQAKLSGMCEAIERYSGVYRGDEPCIHATYNELGDKAIHPYTYLLFSDYQYDNRDSWNKAHNSDYHMAPKRFIEDRKIEWTPFTDIATGETKYIPTGYCYFGHPDIIEYFDTACDANGNAAGNTMEETILQGFLELVERDAVAIWWYNRINRQEIDIDSFGIGYLKELIAYFKTIRRDLIVLNITTDIGIYAFAAISKRTDKAVQDIVLGFGAHLDPKIALLRAITEVNQFMPCVSNEEENGETQYWYEDPEAINWWKTATFENQPYLAPDTSLPKLKLSDLKDLSKDDLKEDVETCVNAAAARGMKTYVLDQTRPDIGLCVAKVVVPGMRHFWKRFGKGRLYDVPTKMGWLSEPCKEEDLNPIGIFF